jgi:hypothetical protein
MINGKMVINGKISMMNGTTVIYGKISMINAYAHHDKLCK